MDTKKKTDILEIFVKIKFGIKLTEEETQEYSNVEDDIKNTLNELINSNSFLYDLEKIVNNIEVDDDFTNEDKNRIKRNINIKKIGMKKN